MLNPEVSAAIVADYASGLSSSIVAARYGVDGATVLQHARRAGVSVRERGRPRTAYEGESDPIYTGGWRRAGLILRPRLSDGGAQ
jgi:hypothetical protein